MTHVFAFDHPHDASGRLSPDVPLRALLGGKGSFLSSLTALDYPVPPGLVITTDAFREVLTANGRLDASLAAEVDAEISRLAERAMTELGRSPLRSVTTGKPPTLFSGRPGATVTMPGMLDTVLNIGMPGHPKDKDL